MWWSAALAQAEAAAEAHEPSLIRIDLTALWQLVVFAIVLYFVAGRLFPVVRKTLAERSERIRVGLEEAADAKQEAEKLLETRRAELARARAEAQGMASEIRQRAEAEAAEIVAQARAEADRVAADARAKLEAERAGASEAMRAQAVQLGILVAEKILQEALDRKRQAKLAMDFIRQVAL